MIRELAFDGKSAGPEIKAPWSLNIFKLKLVNPSSTVVKLGVVVLEVVIELIVEFVLLSLNPVLAELFHVLGLLDLVLLLFVIFSLELQVLLDNLHQPGNLVNWDDLVTENMWMLLIELFGDFQSIRVEYEFVQKDGVDALLGVSLFDFVLDSDEGRVVLDVETNGFDGGLELGFAHPIEYTVILSYNVGENPDLNFYNQHPGSHAPSPASISIEMAAFIYLIIAHGMSG